MLSVIPTGAPTMADTTTPPPEDFTSAFQVSSIYANRVVVTMGPVVRITFGETYNTPDGKLQNRFHTSVALPHQSAIELANILKGMLAEIEKDFEQFKAEQASKAAEAKTDG
jgi:hypothetical protein